MDFTFCSFTYNQEKLIKYQLSSIKYQIDTYGKDVDCYYVLSDDCSSDNTVGVVKEWLDNNGHLFKGVKLIVAESNCGIVANYTTALKNIETECFKILAGDDFYYCNNVFEACQKSNFVISPVLYMGPDNKIAKRSYAFFKNVISCGRSSDSIKQFILSQYRFGGGLVAPGIFIQKMVVDEGLLRALEPYKWVEDAAEFHYLMSQKTTEVVADLKPYIVYRVEEGISQKKDSDANQEYLNDIKRMDQTIHVFRRYWPKMFNPYFYMREWDRIRKVVRRCANTEARADALSFNRIIRETEREAPAYLRTILESED